MPGKLRLDPETLCVDSFDAIPQPVRERGTVRGHVGFTAYGNFTCLPNHTCPECPPPPTD